VVRLRLSTFGLFFYSVCNWSVLVCTICMTIGTGQPVFEFPGHPTRVNSPYSQRPQKKNVQKRLPRSVSRLQCPSPFGSPWLFFHNSPTVSYLWSCINRVSTQRHVGRYCTHNNTVQGKHLRMSRGLNPDLCKHISTRARSTATDQIYTMVQKS